MANELPQEFLLRQAERLKHRRENYDAYYQNPTNKEHADFKWTVLEPILNRAIEKMKEGSYGDCDDCGEPIPLARLEIVPAAIRCIPCQEAFEKKIGSIPK